MAEASEKQLSGITDVFCAVNADRDRVISHPLLDLTLDRVKLQKLMQIHVFAVWDFMFLLSELRKNMYQSNNYWLPSQDAGCLRLINELIISEETDVVSSLNFEGSHFEMYLKAMDEVGADTRFILTFTKLLREGMHIESAALCAHPLANDFVVGNYALMQHGALEMAGALFFGREDIVPQIFYRLKCSNDFSGHPWLCAYLDRHIEADLTAHGKMAGAIVQKLCGQSQDNWRRAAFGARAALKLRAALLDGIYAEVTLGHRSQTLAGLMAKENLVDFSEVKNTN